MTYKIAVLGGDRIGPEVIAEAMKSLDGVRHRFGHVFDWGTGQVGGAAGSWLGNPTPRR